jgi:hypothetical protein
MDSRSDLVSVLSDADCVSLDSPDRELQRNDERPLSGKRPLMSVTPEAAIVELLDSRPSRVPWFRSVGRG